MGTVFIIIGLPIIAYALLRAYQMYLMHQQLEKILEERKLLIEEGVTELPPLQVRGDMFDVLPRAGRGGREAADTAPPPVQQVNQRREEPTPVVPRPPRARNLGILTKIGSILLLLGSLSFLAGMSDPRAFDGLIYTGIIIGLVGLLFFLIYAFTPRDERRRLAEERRANADPFGNLKAGIILLALAATSVAIGRLSQFRYSMPDEAADLLRAISEGLGLLLGCLGLALILIHIIVWLSTLGKRRMPAPPAPQPPPDDATQILHRNIPPPMSYPPADEDTQIIER